MIWFPFLSPGRVVLQVAWLTVRTPRIFLIGNDKEGLWLFYFCEMDSLDLITRRGGNGGAMKRSGNIYRRILAESATAMCGVDPDSLRIMEANHSFSKLFGYSLREALSLTL